MGISRIIGVIIRIFACICLVAVSTAAIAGDLNVIAIGERQDCCQKILEYKLLSCRWPQ